MTDPIADMLTRIRNAISARHERVSIPHSKMKEAIARLLKENNFVVDYKVEGKEFKTIVVELADNHGQTPSISSVQRVSKPGRRIYTSCDDIPLVLGGRGMVIVSTSGGLMSGREARKRGLGGELICKVW